MKIAIQFGSAKHLLVSETISGAAFGIGRSESPETGRKLCKQATAELDFKVADNMENTFMRVNTMLMVVTASLLLGYAANAQAEELNLDFTLVNSTGYTIKEVYISPASADEWGPNIMKGKLKDGQTLEVTFHPKAKAAKWDLRIVWADEDSSVIWRGYKLTEIETITLKYDEDTEKTTAVVE